MTKVKVDVQLFVTGGVGDGKTAITHRILKAIQADQGLQSICKLHPAQSYEILRGELTRLTFTGELYDAVPKTEPFEQGKEIRVGIFEFKFSNGTSVYAWKPDGADMIKGASYAVDVAMLEQKEYNETKGPYAYKEQPKYEPFQVRLSGKSGLMFAYNGKPLKKTDRVITLLADLGTSAVGMHQDDAQTAVTQPAAGSTIDVTIVGGNVELRATGGYVDRHVIADKYDESGNCYPKGGTVSQAAINVWKGMVPNQHGPFMVNTGTWSVKPDQGTEVILNDGMIYKIEPTVVSWIPMQKSTAIAYWRPCDLVDDTPPKESVTVLDFVGNKSAAPENNAHIEWNGEAALMAMVPKIRDQFVANKGTNPGSVVQVILDNGDVLTFDANKTPYSWKPLQNEFSIAYWRRLGL